MAIPATGFLPVDSDRYLEPLKVERLLNGALRIEQPYVKRVGLVDEPHIVFTTTATDDASMKNAWNSLFYAINHDMDGDIDPDYVPFGATEPSPEE